MPVWSQLLFQERIRLRIELLSLFHDYTLAIITRILVFVGGLSLSILFNKYVSDFIIVTSVEVIWTIIPIVVLLFLAVPSLRVLYYIDDVDPYITLKVTGRQWYWTYEIIDLDFEFNSYILRSPNLGEFRLLDVDHRVVLPVGKRVRGLVTGADVIHSWTVPSLGFKADAVPGRLNQVNFNIVRSRVLYGQCSEICGANHRFIPIVVESISPNLFLTWCNNLCVGYTLRL
jgi:cytochrome c oxidase subunit 2